MEIVPCSKRSHWKCCTKYKANLNSSKYLGSIPICLYTTERNHTTSGIQYRKWGGSRRFFRCLKRFRYRWHWCKRLKYSCTRNGRSIRPYEFYKRILSTWNQSHPGLPKTQKVQVLLNFDTCSLKTHLYFQKRLILTLSRVLHILQFNRLCWASM